jgi:hypothetical protein
MYAVADDSTWFATPVTGVGGRRDSTWFRSSSSARWDSTW